MCDRAAAQIWPDDLWSETAMAMGDSVMETPDGAAAAMDVDTALLPRAFPLLLFHMIKTEQSQNGVKHSDYARYRHARFATSIGMGGDGGVSLLRRRRR